MGQEPISCFCSVKQLDVQVHPLDMTLWYVAARDLPTMQPFMQSANQGVAMGPIFGVLPGRGSKPNPRPSLRSSCPGFWADLIASQNIEDDKSDITPFTSYGVIFVCVCVIVLSRTYSTVRISICFPHASKTGMLMYVKGNHKIPFFNLLH